jgi:hypothetical protein
VVGQKNRRKGEVGVTFIPLLRFLKFSSVFPRWTDLMDKRFLSLLGDFARPKEIDWGQTFTFADGGLANMGFSVSFFRC